MNSAIRNRRKQYTGAEHAAGPEHQCAQELPLDTVGDQPRDKATGARPGAAGDLLTFAAQFRTPSTVTVGFRVAIVTRASVCRA